MAKYITLIILEERLKTLEKFLTSHSDTEAILEGYKYGERNPNKLEGQLLCNL